MALAMALAPATATAMAIAAMDLRVFFLGFAPGGIASRKARCTGRRECAVRSWGGAGVRKAGQLLQLVVYNLHGAGASQRGSQSLAAALLQRFLCTPSALVR